MTGPKENNEFCFPKTLNVPRGEAKRNIKVEGKQNSLFPAGPVIECSVLPSNPKIERKTAKNCLPDAGWHTNLLQFQVVPPDHFKVVVSLGSW